VVSEEEEFPDLPARLTPPEGRCPTAWWFFENPRIGYSICFPDGWGLSDLMTSDRLTMVDGRTASQVNLLSGDAFPYLVADRGQPLSEGEVQRMSNFIIITIGAFPPNAEREGCQPRAQISVAGVTGRWCEDTYDILPGPEVRFSPEGTRHTIAFLLPLSRPPLPDPQLPPELRELQQAGDYELYITATTSTTRYKEDTGLIWEVIKAVEAW
jgi:hypothetical protein